MADITIGYKGETIAEISASGTTTLGTSGKYCEDNITLQYVRPSAPTQNDDSIYLFRALPYTSYLKQLQKIIGGTVAWNQLANNGSASVASGHKYISCSSGTWSIGTSNGTAISADMVFDITLMFGSTIADYIYGLGSASCVSWFRNLFSSASYPYDAGSLQSVKTSAHKMVGFNQWDEEWEVGGIDSSTGANVVGTNTIRAKNNIRIIPNTVYHYKCSAAAAVRYYDASGNYLVSYAAAITANSNFTTPSDAAFMRFVVFAAYGTTYNHDICINLSLDGERNGEYEPYVECEYALGGTIELRGILKLDANNNLYYDGDEYASDGTVTRRYGVVDLGMLNWQKTSGKNHLFNTSVSLSTAAYGGSTTSVCHAICSNYVADEIQNTYSNEVDKTVSFTATGYCYIEDSAYSDAATFKTAMSGVYLVYELATQTTESATPYIEHQACFPNGTEQFVDGRTVEMPVEAVAEYEVTS